ncbi:hypothetical protein BCR37DRAFT_385188 [Protomyces lactucae-debilis]|uniref:Uncharacterized protein n=1 Tax=Protomyces lactucae-debilis TaxID=2754530 RepID=A0A1Y2FV87_PROLT|nr:uncharacterized protein BCR37DRAFT_385188 [Protomyces lactucae-debilis]ORY87933.1 hypothetical protein BCR37DRAFT_385188 [Protomyces lactucae-debilis]
MPSVIGLTLLLFLWQVKARQLANWVVEDITQVELSCEWAPQLPTPQEDQGQAGASSPISPAADTRDKSCRIPTEFSIPQSVYFRNDSVILYENTTVMSHLLTSWVNADSLATVDATHVSIKTGALVFLEFADYSKKPFFPNATRVVEMQFFTAVKATESGADKPKLTVSQTNTLSTLVKIPDGCFDGAGMNHFWFACSFAPY